MKPKLNGLLPLAVLLTSGFCNLNQLSATDLLYGGISRHLVPGEYNETNPGVGIEFDNGIGLMTYKNSFFNQTSMIYQRFEVYDAGPIEFSFSAGLQHGYTRRNIESQFPTKFRGWIDESFSHPRTSVVVIPSISFRWTERVTTDVAMVGPALGFSLRVPVGNFRTKQQRNKQKHRGVPSLQKMLKADFLR